MPAPSRRPRPSAAPRRRRRVGFHAVKLAFTLVSLLVLGLTWYGWSSFQDLHRGLSTADVIGPATPDKATDILLVGVDSRTDAQGNPLPREVLNRLRAGRNEGELTDTMILVRIPNDGRHAVAMSLPRDLDVELPDGYGKHKLNSAFTRAKSATAERLVAQGASPATVQTESVAAGRKVLLQAVKELTGVSIDHYAEINLLGFSLLTDAVGGVEVCLREPVHDRFSGTNFRAGPQLISGPDALAFVRQRHGLPRGDLDRIVRQQAYLASLASKVLTAGTLANPSRVHHLISSTQQSLVLDEGFDVLEFATRMQGLVAGNVVFETIPVLGDGYSDSDGSVLEVDPEAVRAFVAQAVESPPASPSSNPPANPESSGPPKSPTRVDVFNGSAITGLAGRVSAQLNAQGFRQGTVGNAKARSGTVVHYPSGDEAAGRMVSEALGGVPIQEDAGLPAGTMQVYLGRNYSGPGKKPIASGLPLSAGTPHEPGVAQPVASESHPGDGPTPPPPAPPQPPMVGGKVPCVS